ncbi:MAG TPA: VWA domain-containing protein [Aggregatilineales bacterium]|nr:VWA domain-containing protein [Anaerolineales bacterium]HRE48752.1 VWA domain-containing protein [Aggregatilineales bacterium]
MRFATPAALILFAVVIPFVVWLGLPRIAHRRHRDTISLALRLLIVTCLIFALSGLQTVEASDKLAVVFLIDASDSIDADARAYAESFIRDSLGRMTVDDRAGIIVFGKNALVERPIAPTGDFLGITSAPVQLDTDISSAIRLGLALFPPDAARRLVILSDGLETVGNAIDAARLAAATNVQIDVVPLRRAEGPEVLVTDVRLPTNVNQGEIFDLGVTVESQIPTTANLSILSAGAVVQSQTVNLTEGVNNFVITLRAPRQGFTDFRVRIDPLSAASTDTYYQNNELAGFTEVTGPPRILLIRSNESESAALKGVLETAGLTVEVASPSELPVGLAPLAGYKAVILANVSATELTDAKMRALQIYVRDLGGGLVVIGGPNSYGVGGYFQTPLEEVLPVEMQIKDQKRIPRLTMIYVIDRSGSMEMIGTSGVTNLELGKEAARRSVNFLFERDRAGVLSFDTNPEWLVPIQFVANRRPIIEQIGALRPGGGTDIYSAVVEIARTLPSDPSSLKHVILLTDGGADETGIVETVKRMHDQHGITVTSIGIGVGVPRFMRDIATVGGGQYYNLTDLSTIPQIFAAETVLATRSYIVEETFTPVLTANSPAMRGIDALPSLLGYVATSAKPTATVILTAQVGGFDDPLLATWQYGLGRAVAFTSDATTRWAQNWTGWTGFQRFWSQVIRSTMVEGIDQALESRVERRDGRSILVVEARDENGAFINGLRLDAVVVDPRLQGQEVTLRQVAPGRYEAEFAPGSEGAYFIRVAGAGGDGLGVAQTTGWVLSYSPEYRLRQTNTRLLDELAALTGGQRLGDDPTLTFRHDIREERAAANLFPLLLLLTALLLPFDIAVRRLIVTQSDLAKLRAWARTKLGIREVALAVPGASRLANLKDAKNRATSTLPVVSEAEVESLRESPSIPTPIPTADTAERTPPKAARAEKAAKPEKTAPDEPKSGSALAARLADQRRQRKKE